MMYLTSQDGKAITKTNAFPVSALGNGPDNTNVQLKVAADGTLYTNTTATATFSDKSEFLVYPKALDFSGKTAGQAYDVPHKAFGRTNYATFEAPSTFSSEFNASNYSNIGVQDGTALGSTASVNTYYAQHLFAFDLLTAAKRTNSISSAWTVSDLIANVKSISVTWVGYGVGANAAAATNGATVKIWNTSGTPAWDGTAVGTNTATSPASIAKTYSTSLGNYIDANGILNVLAHSTYASDGSIASTIYTDYVKVDLVLVGQNMNTLNYGLSRQGVQQVQRINNDGTSMDGNRYEVLITRQTDFATKTQAQTYDVPHVAKKKLNSATFDAPSTFSTEFSNAEYAAAATQDANNMVGTTSTNTYYGQVLFSFDLLTVAKRTPGIPSSWTRDDLLSNIKSITVQWVGYGVGDNSGAANGATLKRWNPSTSAWADIGTNTATSPSAVSSTTSSSFTAVIDAQGYVHYLAHSTYASNGVNPSTIYTDYIKITMTLVGAVLNDTGVAVTMEEPLGAVTVSAGATSAAWSNIDVSRCEQYAVAINPSATHTYSVTFAPVGRDNVELVAAADRDAVIASASQGKKLSALIDIRAPKGTIYITNGDAADKTYYGRLERKNVRGGQL